MNGAIPVVFALLLVCSLPAMAVSDAGGSAGMQSEPTPSHHSQLAALPQFGPAETENTTNRLLLTGEIESQHTTYGSDLGTVLASSDDELRIDHEQYVLAESEFESGSIEEREAMLERAYLRLDERIDGLEEREREAVQAHADGELTDRELTQTLLRNHNEATALSESIEELDDRAIRIPGYSFPPEEIRDGQTPSEQLRADNTMLDFHRTSLRTSLDSVSRAPGSERELLIETSADGYRLSAIEGETYHVETVRFDNRDQEGSGNFGEWGHVESLEHANRLYPWAADSIGGGFPVSDDLSTARNFYWIEYRHGQGTLEVFLDGGTGGVHREIQELSIPSMPELDGPSWTDDDLELTLNRTPSNGPAAVTVTDATTDEPVEATITVNGTVVGETDPEDGTLWIVQPTDEYEIAAETATGSVNGTVSEHTPAE